MRKGSRRAIEWIIRRLYPFEELACTLEPVEASGVANGSGPGPALVSEAEPETPLEHGLRASLEAVTAKKNGNGHNGVHQSGQPPPTKLEHALKTAISAAYNAERFGAELGYVVRFDADAIKSMAITVLINMTGGNNR